jgi:cyclopropane fatty-acyl-phospholipid synthase-like methyltransferase
MCDNPDPEMLPVANEMKNKQRRNKKTMAELADRHVLYEKSVQDVDQEYHFVNKTFRKLRSRRPYHVREDFCGTASMCCEWVRRRKKNTAVGVDLDPEVLAWARENNLARLKPEARERVTLIEADVFEVQTPQPFDVVLAMNFSYQLFMTREKLGAYFRKVRESLVDDGILFLDAFGGYDTYREIKEKRKYKGYKYIWEHASYNPIDGRMVCHIHFAFPDGSRLKRAFSYQWRMWTLPELRDLLVEAGYSRVTVYWEDTDPETGEGAGVYSPATVGDADPGWVCFLIAEK